MHIKIGHTQFIQAFEECRPGVFSYNGLVALYEHLSEVEVLCNCEIELDVIGLCCDYAEYADMDEFRDDYGSDYDSLDDVRAVMPVIKIKDSTAFIVSDL